MADPKGGQGMGVKELLEIVAASEWDALETAWTQAVEAGAPPKELAKALEALVAAGEAERAEMLGWTYLAERIETLAPTEALAAAQAFLSAVPESQELRSEAVAIFRRLRASHPHLEALLSASGLAGEQSPRRAFRTLQVGLSAPKGSYLANRFDHQVLRVEGFEPATGEFTLVDGAGRSARLDPQALADDYDPVDANDFRVLRLHRPDELRKLLADDPATVLVGMCLWHGGRIDANEMKKALVPQHLSAEAWGGWWNSARTAARKHPQLALEGRTPLAVVYYPQGRSLEEEMAADSRAAWSPLERLTVLQQYLRQARQRKVAPSESFTRPLVEALAEQARSHAANASAALAASVALGRAVEAGLLAPGAAFPTPGEVLAASADPAQAVAGLEDGSFWPQALEALAQRADAAAHLQALLKLAPADQLDSVVARLEAAGAAGALAEAAAQALADPLGNLELYLWLWRTPAAPLAQADDKVKLLSRVLALLSKLDHDHERSAPERKAIRHRIRAALAERDYVSYRRALEQMNPEVAETFKGQIHRSTGLAQAVRDDMLQILREKFPALFVLVRVEPWLDERILWTTEEALRKRREAMKELEVKTFENARAIGAAAQHGDLSENSEWKFALEERDMLRARTAKLQNELARARVIRPEDVPDDRVGVGSRVFLMRLDAPGELELSILGAWDTDLPRNVFSYQAAFALDLLGKPVGEEVELKLQGREGRYRIERVASAL